VPERRLAKRLQGLPVASVFGGEVPIATGLRIRLFGLAHLDRDEAGPGLLIPRCSSVHTFGMRFPLDLYFLDGRGAVREARREVPPRRLASCRGAEMVLEICAGEGGEFSALRT
jgi:uncharacterized membrane protein (UPF0127 family)